MVNKTQLALDKFWDSKDIQERLKKKLDDKSVVRPNGCIEWTGCVNNGYGNIYVCGSNMGAYRLSWIIANGRNPGERMEICHTCDNRLCINPQHLFEGTTGDNQRDSHKKGRNYFFGYTRPNGENNVNATRTWKMINDIRREFDNGVGWKELSEKYNILGDQVRDILRNKTWVDISYVPHLPYIVKQKKSTIPPQSTLATQGDGNGGRG